MFLGIGSSSSSENPGGMGFMASRLFQNCRSENCVVCGSRIDSIVLRIDSIVTRIDSIVTRIDSVVIKIDSIVINRLD